MTIVFSSHLMHEVEFLCDRVAIINQGKLIANAATDSLISYDKSQVEVILEGAESAAKRLDSQDWVKSVEVKSGRLSVELNEDTAHQLNAYLVNAGYQVSAVIPRQRTLRDYFLKVLNQ